MVDFNMVGLQGDQLVRLIRDTDHIYLPVIFYSSSTVETLLDAVRSAELDGVYIANRDFLINKVKDVIGSLLVKEQTVKQVRGLLMEGVSEVDAQFFEIFSKVWADIDEEKRKEIGAYLRDIVANRVKSAKSKLAKFPSDAENFNDHIRTKFLTAAYDTHTRWRVTMKILELVDHSTGDLAELKKFAKKPEGEKSLNELRNDYAHKSRKLLADGHTVEHCVSIRKTLRAQFANIDAIMGSE